MSFGSRRSAGAAASADTFPPYEPKVWCLRARGADPNKVVRTFNRAPISAGFRSLPAGDSVLYCGNEKYGLLHLYAKGHDADWSAFTFPWMGNWRNLADYAISAALSYPRIGDLPAVE